MGNLFKKIVFAVFFFLTFGISSAYAIPAFARQTGLDCTACHTVFPELTATGRYFKLTGYTMTGGSDFKPFIDNLAGMVQASYTQNANTNAGPLGSITPAQNANALLQAASIFYGGKIYGDLGAFVQITYNGGPSLLNSPNTSFINNVNTDNTEFRLADTFKIMGSEVVAGLTLNNNPTMSDIYNSTPVWGFPYVSSGNVNKLASALVQGQLGSQVAGLGAYAMIADTLYLEVAGYSSLRNSALSPLLGFNSYNWQSDGTLPTQTMQGTSLYTRLALQQYVGDNFFMVGGYSLNAQMNPNYQVPSNGLYDGYTDRAIDAQYQYTNGSHIVAFNATKIWEKQKLNNTFANGGASNLYNTLTTSNAKISYYYEQKYGVSVGAFASNGSSDSTLYSGQYYTPKGSGQIFELDYLPTKKLKLTAAYTMYNTYTGSAYNYNGGSNYASDPSMLIRNANYNNNLYISAMLLF